MAYNELIKHFQRIRDYIHEFYTYGFKSRENILYKSQRSYDNERRRLESYLKDYMSFQYQNSKYVFLSIDSRHIAHNPLYKVFQSKSFTDKSITLHFIIMDILYNDSVQLTLKDIIYKVDEYLSYFHQPIDFDESTIRKKLNSYIKLGIIEISKRNHQNYFKRTPSLDIQLYEDVLLFYSEIDSLGVIGSYLLNRIHYNDIFSFKHHFISYAIDSEIIYYLFLAMNQKKYIMIHNHNSRTHKESYSHVLPLKILISSQTGRSHLLAYVPKYKSIKSYRIDYIQEVIIKEDCPQYDIYRQKFIEIQSHIWSIQYIPQHLEHVEFIIEVKKNEEYIYQRLLREKRIGNIIQIDKHHYQFMADVYDTYELLPWIRTLICRIKQLNFSNRTAENRLKQDIQRMYEMYEIGDEET